MRVGIDDVDKAATADAEHPRRAVHAERLDGPIW